MKSPIKQFGLKVIRNDIIKKVPIEVISLPSKVINFHKKRKDNSAFVKEVKELTALFREKGFPESVIKDAPLIIEELNNAKQTLDRLADNGLH